MKHGSLGLQWKLTAILLAVTLLGAAAVTAGFLAATAMGRAPTVALAAGLAAGVTVGLIGTAAGLSVARSIKLRLWEAGDMAATITRGDFSVRLPAEVADEIGVLELQLNRMAGHLESAVADLRRLAEQNRLLAEEAGRGAALEERARLARDLHDTVNQQLFVLAMRTAAARRRLVKIGGEAAALAPELTALEELSRQAHSETRGLILQLRPATLEQQGVGAALVEYVRAAGVREGWEVVLDVDQTVRLDGPTGENLFRIAQEVLNNTSKHARAGTVQVTLQRSGHSVLLCIRDDGEGFDTRAGLRPTAVGLAGMQERAAAMGGALRVTSSPGGGTEISITLTLPEGGIAT